MVGKVLGLDIAKASFHATLLVEGKTYHRTFSNRPAGFEELVKWWSKHTSEHPQACMEATGSYWEAVATYLHDHGCVVSVVNPMRIHDYARSKLSRNKTDKVDSALIADFCLTQNPPAWAPPAAEIRHLRDLVRRLEDLQDMHTQENNRAQAGETTPQVQQMIANHLAFLNEQITQLQKEIQEHIDHHPDLKRQRDLLVSIQGIGLLTAAKLLGENIQTFTSTRAAVAFAGLNPRQHDSGTSVHGKPHLSKLGSGHLRRALYFPAITAIRFNPIVQAFCQRLEDQGKHCMVVIGAAMRKLLCLAIGVLKSGVPFDPNYLVKVLPSA